MRDDLLLLALSKSSSRRLAATSFLEKLSGESVFSKLKAVQEQLNALGDISGNPEKRAKAVELIPQREQLKDEMNAPFKLLGLQYGPPIVGKALGAAYSYLKNRPDQQGVTKDQRQTARALQEAQAAMDLAKSTGTPGYKEEVALATAEYAKRLADLGKDHPKQYAWHVGGGKGQALAGRAMQGYGLYTLAKTLLKNQGVIS